MNKQEGASPYGKGFMIRMAVLLGILVLALGGFFYDRTVLVPGGEKKVAEVQRLVYADTDDGQGIPKSQVQETIGNWASKSTRTFKQEMPESVAASEDLKKTWVAKEYEIESYKFKRILPFMASQELHVAYANDTIVYASAGKKITDELLNNGFESSLLDRDNLDEIMPTGMGGGSPGGGIQSRPSDDDEKEEEKEKEKEKEKENEKEEAN